jgi:hypothetical protein
MSVIGYNRDFPLIPFYTIEEMAMKIMNMQHKTTDDYTLKNYLIPICKILASKVSINRY